MITTTSPSGRSSTPRRTAAAHTRRPQRTAPSGGASSTPTMRPASAHLGHAGRGRPPTGRAGRPGGRRPHARGPARPTRRAAAGGGGPPRRPGRSRRRSGRGRRSPPEVVAEECLEHPPDATVADSGRYPPVIPLPRQTRSGRKSGPAHSEANSRPVRPNPVATSSQISSTPWARQARPTAARSSGSATRIPDAPWTNGSMIMAASVSAWASTAATALAAQSALA